MNIYDQLGVRTIINAKGPATRLSGGMMRPEVVAAMANAAAHCVDMAELQAAASHRIAAATGAEAGYVASGASACLLLAAAACLAGLSPGRMARLPQTDGMKNEIIMIRSQRNFYDHAVRAAGARIIEVGLPDRYAGAGVRDAEAWEIDDAVTDRTAAIFYVAHEQAQPSLPTVKSVAERHGLPVIVDAAAQLPPASNLKRFISEGADLVAFSGGKVLGGPQTSGFLCGKRDLIMSAALQHLDLDIHDRLWSPPESLIDRRKLVGVPQHGIGRSCKAGKEEIVGLLVALDLFLRETDAKRHQNWLTILQAITSELKPTQGASWNVEGELDEACVPLLVISCHGKAGQAEHWLKQLAAASPAVHVDVERLGSNQLVINPVCIAASDAVRVGRTLQHVLQQPAFK